jgi:large subunit ribosomal protein L35
LDECDSRFENQKIGENNMPKMKSKRALMKRIKVTGSGKVKRHSAYTSHLAPRKSTKQKRHLRKAKLVSNSDYKRIKFLIIK